MMNWYWYSLIQLILKIRSLGTLCRDLENQISRAEADLVRMRVERICQGLLILEIFDDHQAWQRDIQVVKRVVESGEKNWEVQWIEGRLRILEFSYPPLGDRSRYMSEWQIEKIKELRGMCYELGFFQSQDS